MPETNVRHCWKGQSLVQQNTINPHKKKRANFVYMLQPEPQKQAKRKKPDAEPYILQRSTYMKHPSDSQSQKVA